MTEPALAGRHRAVNNRYKKEMIKYNLLLWQKFAD